MDTTRYIQGELSIAVFLMLASSIFVCNLHAQNRQFSSTAEYQSMLEELHHQPVRPSHMSAGTLLATARPPADLSAVETAETLHLETEAWRLEVTKSYWTMALTNKQTGLTWQLGRPRGDSAGISWIPANQVSALQLAKVEHIERHGDCWRMQMEVAGSTAPASVEIDVISSKVIRVSIRAPQLKDTADMALHFTGLGPYFGLGERFDRVELDGLRTVLRPEDLLGKPGHNWTYLPVPLLFTPHGLGMYFDTAAVSSFDLTGATQGAFSVQIQNRSVDLYLFVGEPKSVLKNYTALTGRSPVPPPWTFGVWICSYQGPQTVLADARRLRKERIPASAIWTFDVMGRGNIMGWPLWWTGYYPNPRQFTDEVHSMGFKVLTYIHPYLRSVLDPYNLPNLSYERGKRSGLLVLDAEGKPSGPAFEPFRDGNIDFTSAANVNWWGQKVRNILVTDNFDGWMEDFGEWVNDTDRFAAGVSGRTMANLNPLFYHKITYEIARKAKPDVVEFDRSGYAGSQGYSRVIWGGDQFPNWSQDYGLPSVVRAGITAGLSGFAVWGPDIAGNGHSTELWTRWVEFGALTPVMRNHLWDKPEGAVDLWYDGQTIETFRRYAQLHISLFPYFYTYAQDAAKTGLPIIRHPMLDYPDDPKTYDLSAEYLLGDRILVAPVVQQGAVSRSLYLPQGSWTDYWSGKVIEGGRQVTIPAPLQQIPILVRSGSILPFISPNTQTLADNRGAGAGDGDRTLSSDLTWRVFPATASVRDSFTLYDGTVAKASEEPSQTEVWVTHSPMTRHYEVILPDSRPPREVTLGGNSLREVDLTDGKSEKAGWRMDNSDGNLHVFFPAADFDLKVQR